LPEVQVTLLESATAEAEGGNRDDETEAAEVMSENTYARLRPQSTKAK
jgi:hypothetical protein